MISRCLLRDGISRVQLGTSAILFALNAWLRSVVYGRAEPSIRIEVETSLRFEFQPHDIEERWYRKAFFRTKMPAELKSYGIVPDSTCN